ncbi:MAG: hypothetical protein K0Q46_5558 [Rhodococcus erythropolis]|jgi:hypothetical protein|nr:hypothetical protein [Rhodococcus erythropolis]
MTDQALMKFAATVTARCALGPMSCRLSQTCAGDRSNGNDDNERLTDFQRGSILRENRTATGINPPSN